MCFEILVGAQVLDNVRVPHGAQKLTFKLKSPDWYVVCALCEGLFVAVQLGKIGLGG